MSNQQIHQQNGFKAWQQWVLVSGAIAVSFLSGMAVMKAMQIADATIAAAVRPLEARLQAQETDIAVLSERVRDIQETAISSAITQKEILSELRSLKK